MSKERLSIILLCFITIFWGFSFLLIDSLFEHFGSLFIIGIRFFIASSVLFILKYKEIIENFKENLVPGLIIGIILFLAFSFQITGQSKTSISNTAFLTALNVVFAPFLALIILKDKIPPKVYVAAVGAFIGIALITIDGGLTSLSIGDILIIICALGFAGHIIAVGYFNKTKNLNLSAVVFIQLGFTSLLGIIGSLLFEDNSFSDLTLQSTAVFLYIALFSSLFAYFGQNYAQKHVSSSKTAIILSTESIFGTLFAVLFGDEGGSIDLNFIIGAALIFISVIITEVDFRREKA